MAVIKTEVVSVTVGPSIKAAPQAAASLEMRSLANMVEVMVVPSCESKGISVKKATHQPSSTASSNHS